ncbi:MAG: nucleotidyltransferase [Betaproteobacteria bacterium]|jgi:predicted nucleotidyltransferase|nr:nucleotidyltransferase [Betaproteobacteria bacterium]MBK8108765.1 nucleotidyltransferase [Betaproteobacteria bacterium]
MKRHLYAFGSLCRGEIDELSDVDLLACVETQDQARTIDTGRFSVYTRDRIRVLWREGNPFAWHLHLEAKLVFASDGADFLRELGVPREYEKADEDCVKFMRLFEESVQSLHSTSDSQVFHLSCIFLAARNFATCYSFTRGSPIFSRRSPLLIESPVALSTDVFDTLVRARVLSTRGIGEALTPHEISVAVRACPQIHDWMQSLLPSEVSV